MTELSATDLGDIRMSRTMYVFRPTCFSDGRNHGQCCDRAGIPDVCQDMCVGEYNMQTDDIRTHIACSEFTAPTLACIAEGVSKFKYIFRADETLLLDLS